MIRDASSRFHGGIGGPGGESGLTQQRLSSFFYRDLEVESLPEQFLDFCRKSLNSTRGEFLYTEPVAGEPVAPRSYDEEPDSLDVIGADEDDIIALTPLPSNKQVAAVDTSTIKLGELEGGSLCALRGAIVYLHDHRYRYARYGPLVFSAGTSHSENLVHLGIPPVLNGMNDDFLLKRVRNHFEHWLQLSACRSVRNGFVLVDGSLTAGTPDNSVREVQEILADARRSQNLVIGISKNTKLRIRDKSIISLLKNAGRACLLDIDEQVAGQFPSYPLRFLGRVFVGKLSSTGFTFRVDVDRELGMGRIVDGFHELIGTEIVDQGYPETLRVAHILSTFTASDVLAIQAFAANQFGVQLAPKIALRRSLFGPFGTGWEAWH